MSQPTTRVLAVLDLLQTHGRISGSELARRLGVDGRTLRRYIGTLEEMGIPLTAERGRHGAYMLVAGFKLPPMMFTDDEALALAVGLLAARSLGLAAADAAVASAQAKLERVMPARLKHRVRAIDETVTLDLTRPAPPRRNRALAVLSSAAQAEQTVRMRYRPFEPRPEGILFRTSTDGIEWIARQLARLSFDFEIRTPPELRGALRAHALRLERLAET